MFYIGVIFMYDYSVCPHYDILCIDLKSFFASVSCRLKGLDPKTTKLAVVGDTKSIGSVVLAATPELKKLGIKTGSRLFEIPARSDIYIINPSMKIYLDYSMRITEIALKYVAPEDFHQYSVDEFFMDVTHSYKLFADSPKELAKLIKDEIYEETKIGSAIGTECKSHGSCKLFHQTHSMDDFIDMFKQNNIGFFELIISHEYLALRNGW